MNTESPVRRISFGEVLSGSGGGCATIAVALVLGGVSFAVRWHVTVIGFDLLTMLIFLIIWARRIEIAYDTSTGMVTVSRRHWPFQGESVLQLRRSEISAFVIAEVDAAEENETKQIYGFRMKDGKLQRVTNTGSNALGHDVVAEVNRILDS